MVSIDVVFQQDQSAGWAPVTFLGLLAARLFDSEAQFLPKCPNKLRRLIDLHPRKVGSRKEALLAILHNPHDVGQLRALEGFRTNYRQVAIWIVDSFHHDWVPSRAALRDIDVVAVMRPNDEEPFRRVASGRTLVLGWGSDALSLGSGKTERPTDVLRLGRQPLEWDDDEKSQVACNATGLAFSGRPPIQPTAIENQTNLMNSLANTKFVIAHSNLAAPASYTHPTQEYITARWSDALACGATVAGVQPRSDKSMDRLLWPGAVLDFDRIDLKHNVAALAEACALWRPENAMRNYRNALERLDWRWRLADIVARLGVEMPKPLAAELAEVCLKLAALDTV